MKLKNNLFYLEWYNQLLKKKTVLKLSQQQKSLISKKYWQQLKLLYLQLKFKNYVLRINFIIIEVKVSIIQLFLITLSYEQIGKILDVQIDEDLLFFCGNKVGITNIRSGKEIPSAIKTNNQNEQQIEMMGEQDLFCTLLYYRKKNTLFIGTTSGKLIEYDLLYCNSQVHYQHTRQIIYLQIHKKQSQTGIQDILVTAAKDSFIYFWPLIIQDLKQLKPFESKQILLQDQEINNLWYFDQQNFFIFQSQNGYYLAAYISESLQYYKISDYDPTNKYDYNNNKQAFYQLTFEKPTSQHLSKPTQLTKTMILQEAVKAHYQENNNYKAEIVLLDYNKQKIITTDDDANILFWNINGEYTDKIQPFDTNQPQQVQIGLSNKFNSLICGCFDGNSHKFLIAMISLEDQKKQDIVLAIEGEQQPKLKQLQILSQDLILILTDSKDYNINIYSINEAKNIQQMKDSSGESNGSAVLTLEQGKNLESVFLTYGSFNQLTYYEKRYGNYATRFKFGEAIKKLSYFNINHQKTTSSNSKDDAKFKVISKHGINLMKIFK